MTETKNMILNVTEFLHELIKEIDDCHTAQLEVTKGFDGSADLDTKEGEMLLTIYGNKELVHTLCISDSNLTSEDVYRISTFTNMYISRGESIDLRNSAIPEL